MDLMQPPNQRNTDKAGESDGSDAASKKKHSSKSKKSKKHDGSSKSKVPISQENLRNLNGSSKSEDYNEASDADDKWRRLITVNYFGF